MSGVTVTVIDYARMSRKQLIAEDWLRAAARRGYEPHGVVTYDASAISDGTPWIHWRTARALEARGIVRIDYHPGEGADIYIVPAAASGEGEQA